MGDSMELNFEVLEMQKWNIPMVRAPRVYEKNGIISLFIMFTPKDVVIKISKMAHFLYFLLVAAKNWSQFRPNIYVHLKELTKFFKKMLKNFGFWATIN